MQENYKKQGTELVSLQQSQTEALTDKNELETQLTDANDELTNLQAQLTDSTNKLTSLESDIEDKNRLLAQAEEDRNKLIGTENRLVEIEKTLNDTLNDIQTKDAQISQAEEVLKELEQAILELSGKYEELDSGTTSRLNSIRDALMEIQLDDEGRGSTDSFDSFGSDNEERLTFGSTRSSTPNLDMNRGSSYNFGDIYGNDTNEDQFGQENPNEFTTRQKFYTKGNVNPLQQRPLNRPLRKRANARQLSPEELSEIQDQVIGEQPVKAFALPSSTENNETKGGKRSKSKTKSKMKSTNKKHTRRHKKLGKVSKKHTGKQKPKKKHVSRKMKKKGGYNSQCHTM